MQIFVLPGCLGCQTAAELAEQIRAAALPGVAVRVIDLSAPAAVKPAAVFAVPTYVLDGRVVSKGNPDLAWLLARLSALSQPASSRRSRLWTDRHC